MSDAEFDAETQRLQSNVIDAVNALMAHTQDSGMIAEDALTGAMIAIGYPQDILDHIAMRNANAANQAH